jgi:hypothetical protein
MRCLAKKTAALVAAILLSGAVTLTHAAPAAGPVAAPPPGYKAVTFAFLAKYEVSNDRQYIYSLSLRKRNKPQALYFKIPPAIKALDGTNVEITGYMMPIEDPVKGQLHKFVVFRNPITCCFGCANMINEYMTVTLKGDEMVKYTPDTPITVRGKLSVGGVFEQGYLLSIYQMAADAVTPAPGATWR